MLILTLQLNHFIFILFESINEFKEFINKGFNKKLSYIIVFLYKFII